MTGSLTGRGSPWIRGSVIGLMTTAVALGIRFPFDFEFSCGDDDSPSSVVMVELAAMRCISGIGTWIPLFCRRRFSDYVGGLLVFFHRVFDRPVS